MWSDLRKRDFLIYCLLQFSFLVLFFAFFFIYSSSRSSQCDVISVILMNSFSLPPIHHSEPMCQLWDSRFNQIRILWIQSEKPNESICINPSKLRQIIWFCSTKKRLDIRRVGVEWNQINDEFSSKNVNPKKQWIRSKIKWKSEYLNQNSKREKLNN